MYARAMHVKHAILADRELWESVGVHPSILDDNIGGMAKFLSSILDKHVQWLRRSAELLVFGFERWRSGVNLSALAPR